MSFAAMLVHVDAERENGSRVELARGLAKRFDAALIGVAGREPQPDFAAAGIAIYSDPAPRDAARMAARFEEMGKRFCAQSDDLDEVEWRASLDPVADAVLREARAADLVIIGSQRRAGRVPDLADPGTIVLRAGRPVLVVPEAVAAVGLERAVVAWKDTRECRRAVRDAIPLLQRAGEVRLLAFAEGEMDPQKSLADVRDHLGRHGIAVAEATCRRPRGAIAAELIEVVRGAEADLVVAGGYGHSRLGEWMFGGVTQELLARSPVCCLLAH
jgi:nucleotide-binding universal stress UspA family protein